MGRVEDTNGSTGSVEVEVELLPSGKTFKSHESAGKDEHDDSLLRSAAERCISQWWAQSRRLPQSVNSYAEAALHRGTKARRVQRCTLHNRGSTPARRREEPALLRQSLTLQASTRYYSWRHLRPQEIRPCVRSMPTTYDNNHSRESEASEISV